ncbi:DUF4245 domain-containing protein [Candidatus Nanopelagicales bacterium]|nr:DUF4245 domain-containing protein [Candidatus Nanopelagicales bacterium]
MSEAPTISSDPQSDPDQAAGPIPAKGSLRKTISDIVISMGLILAVIAVLMLITWRPQPDPVRAVNPFPVANLADRDRAFKVSMPDLDEGWRATSARLEPTPQSADKSVWYNGWVSPNGEFFAVAQSSATHTAFVNEQTGQGVVVQPESGTWPWAEDQKLNKNKWISYLSADGQSKSLVRVEPDQRTTVVTSSADWPQLQAFAESLTTVKKAAAAAQVAQ